MDEKRVIEEGELAVKASEPVLAKARETSGLVVVRPLGGVLLVIEDEKATARVLEELAKVEGWQNVESVGSLAQATEALEKRRFAAAIVDLELPDGCGRTALDVLERQQADCVVYCGRPPRYPVKVPVILKPGIKEIRQWLRLTAEARRLHV